MVGIVADVANRVATDTPATVPGAAPAWRMNAAALHTPLEELLFFQSLRALGADVASFARISTTLQENEFVRSSPAFDADRLSPSNLQALYLRLLKDEVRSGLRQAAPSPSKSQDANLRKRKLSTPPLQSLDEAAAHTHLLPQLIDRLYARYQAHVVRAIREDEAQYDALTKDIAAIERGEWDDRLSKGEVANGLDGSPSAAKHARDIHEPPRANLQAPDAPLEQPATAEVGTNKNILASQDLPTSALSATSAAPSQSRSPRANQAVSGTINPPDAAATTKRRSSKSPHPQSDQQAETPARQGSQPTKLESQPKTFTPHQYGTPQTGGFSQPPPSQSQQNQPFVPYAAYGPKATMPTYPSPSPRQPNLQQMQQAPQFNQATPYAGLSSPHPGYMVYQSQGAGFATPHLASMQTPASGGSRKPFITPINTSVSTTKWKATGPAQKSPVPPPHSPFLPSSPELSPTEGTAKTPVPPNRRLEDLHDAGTPTRTSNRRGRGTGPTGRGQISRAAKETRTRSQSITSHADESAPELPQARRLRGTEVGTPNPAIDDTSAISTPASSSRLGHRRNTLRGSIDTSRPLMKRKRTNTLEGSPDPPSFPRQPNRPNHVLATKNFHRIVQPLMQEINSHKLASIFAKPITERDAPGYQSIVYQPQDLKSIRAAISVGTRAIQNAEKESNEAGEDVASPAAVPGSAGGGAKSSASIWLDKSVDVVPPKAIVNAGQMEKEVYRMFANAVMFNLDPHRGLGAAERRPKGLDNDEQSDEEDIEKHYEVDDGGAFVRDAREMFESVEESTSRWRAVEGGGTKARGGEESEAEEPTTDA